MDGPLIDSLNLHALQYFFEKLETFKVQTKYSFSFRLSSDKFQSKFRPKLKILMPKKKIVWITVNCKASGRKGNLVKIHDVPRLTFVLNPIFPTGGSTMVPKFIWSHIFIKINLPCHGWNVNLMEFSSTTSKLDCLNFFWKNLPICL